jgi:hypothetical protein
MHYEELVEEICLEFKLTKKIYEEALNGEGLEVVLHSGHLLQDASQPLRHQPLCGHHLGPVLCQQLTGAHTFRNT